MILLPPCGWARLDPCWLEPAAVARPVPGWPDQPAGFAVPLTFRATAHATVSPCAAGRASLAKSQPASRAGPYVPLTPHSPEVGFPPLVHSAESLKDQTGGWRPRGRHCAE
jgi:hypothetical protein